MPETKYWKALNDALRLEMERDDRIVVLGEDVAGAAGREDQGLIDAWGGPFGVTRGLIKQFGATRVRDTPISEAAFLGSAVGLAVEGFRPWVDIMFQELTAVAWDQLTNRIARSRYLSAGQGSFPITIKTFGECYSAICHYPGLIAVAPSDAFTAKGLMIAAIREDNPVIVFDSLRLLRQSMDVPERSYEVALGEARRVREGSDLSILGIGVSTALCVEAADRLRESGIFADVLDLLTLMPWDVDRVVESVSRTGHLLIVDFDHPACSLSAEIAATVASHAWSQLKAAPVRLCPPGVPAMLMDGTPAMAALYYPSAESVFRASLGIVGARTH